MPLRWLVIGLTLCWPTDWPSAGAADPAVASRLTAARARLVQSDEPTSAWDQAAAVLATNKGLRAAFWLMALLLYAAAWMRIAGVVFRSMGSGVLLALVAMVAAAAIVIMLFWADTGRQRTLSETLAVVRRGEPPFLREGNGLSYPATSEARLRPAPWYRFSPGAAVGCKCAPPTARSVGFPAGLPTSNEVPCRERAESLTMSKVALREEVVAGGKFACVYGQNQ